MCHVLIIEDEPLIALDLELVFRLNGALSVSFADTQEAALVAARARRPDFILSDVALREGTGPLALVSILSEFGSIPAIFLTATPSACSPCPPPCEIFTKPFDEQVIGAAFRRLAFAG